MKIVIFMTVFGAALAACGISVTNKPVQAIALITLVSAGLIICARATQ